MQSSVLVQDDVDVSSRDNAARKEKSLQVWRFTGS